MKFNQKLQYAFYGCIAEGARFTLPHTISLPKPDGGTAPVRYLDMRWEDYSDGIHNRWEQYHPFVAKLPFIVGTSTYLVWDPDNVKQQCYFADIGNLPDFPRAPDHWWEMVQGIDEHGKVTLAPARRRAWAGEYY